MGLGKSFKKAVGKVSHALGGNAYGSVFKAEAAKKQAQAEAAEKVKAAQHDKEAAALAEDIKKKRSAKSQNSLISNETIQQFMRSILG